MGVLIDVVHDLRIFIYLHLAGKDFSRVLDNDCVIILWFFALLLFFFAIILFKDFIEEDLRLLDPCIQVVSGNRDIASYSIHAGIFQYVPMKGGEIQNY